MKPLHAGFAALCLLIMTVLVVAGGRALNPGADAEPQSESGIVFDTEINDVFPEAEPEDTAPEPSEAVPQSSLPSRPIEPDVIAPPPLEPSELERLPPREPLSELSLAVPPKPKPDAEWKGATLFRPLATGAGRIKAQGRTVTVAGIDPVAPDETCTDSGRQWPCGTRATTAFRAFLRGRAVVCDIPENDSEGDFTARCRLARQDIGEWLVENGWARAPQDGPYAQAAEKARKGRKGIYGHAPDLSGLPPAPAQGSGAPAAPDSIIELPGPPELVPATPPDGLPAPSR
ncbi:thermonuclease family protein [Aquamicrobium terrae]|uniref:Endonuclease YncB(Thermonuclease family) n=1 Tax=Aquamicrobium terrae TaxID=1324945 RepID=A0ABV2N1C0_9HYPH